MKRMIMTILGIAVFCLAFSAIPNSVHAAVFMWIDQNHVIHYANLEPDWWKKEHLVYIDKRLVDKPKTLKKAGLPLESPDFSEKMVPGSDMALTTAQGRLSFSSSGNNGGVPLKTDQDDMPYEIKFIKPSTPEEIDAAAPGSVLVDEASNIYHTPDCSQLVVKGHDRLHYKMPPQRTRIFSSPDDALQGGYQPCPVCGGKPK